MTKLMQPARLKLYYNYLGDFDFIDKTPQIFNPSIIGIKPTTLNIRFDSNNCQSNKSIIAKSLVSEAFGNQRFSIKNPKKIFLKTLLFELTLRKETLLLFLDNCLNTIFLYEHKSLTLDNLKLDSKLYFHLSNELINHFFLTSTKLEFSISMISPKKGLTNWAFYPTS